MNRATLALLILSTCAGCLTPEERAARRAEKEQIKAEKKAKKAEEEKQEQAEKAAQAKADADAQAQRNASDAQRAEQERSVNLETMCKTIADSYSKHCGGKSSKTYLWCLGNQPPATTAALNWGQTQACGADISQADCAVLDAGVLPASCGQVSPAAQQQPTAAPQKDPGGVTVGKACGPLMEQHCNKCDPSNMKSCVDESLSWCYNGRDAKAGTGMTPDQYATCSKAYKGLRCDAAGTGYVPMDCPGLR